MAFNITLYKFEKRTNSDKIPDIYTQKTFLQNCRLKSSTDILQPVIIINWEFSFYPDFNYCYVDAFKRYYFINTWQYVSPTWQAHCTVDVLASYHDKIANTYQYIKRASYANAVNTHILDSVYPTTEPNYKYSQSNITGLTADFSAGSYVVGIIGKGTNSAHAGVDYYVMNKTELKALINYLFRDTSYTGVVNVDTDLMKTMFDPFQYIVSLNWFPIDKSNMPTNGTAQVNFGWWESSGITASILSQAAVYQVNGSVSIPRHSQIQEAADQTPIYYFMLAPYSRYTLFCGGFGEIPIDSTAIYGSNLTKLYIKIRIDLITGAGKLYLATTNDTAAAFQVERTMCGVPVQISQIAGDVFGTMDAVLDTAEHIARPLKRISDWRDNWANSGTWYKELLAGLTTPYIAQAGEKAYTELSAAASCMPQVKTKSSTGSVQEWANIPYLVLQEFKVPDRNNTDIIGLPAAGRHLIDDIPGYIEIDTPQIEWPVTSIENQMLCGMMSNGFYHE